MMRKYDIYFSCKAPDMAVKWVETINRLLGTVAMPHVEEIEKRLAKESEKNKSLVREIHEMRSQLAINNEKLQAAQTRENNLTTEIEKLRFDLDKSQQWQSQIMNHESSSVGKLKSLNDSISIKLDDLKALVGVLQKDQTKNTVCTEKFIKTVIQKLDHSTSASSTDIASFSLSVKSDFKDFKMEIGEMSKQLKDILQRQQEKGEIRENDKSASLQKIFSSPHHNN